MDIQLLVGWIVLFALIAYILVVGLFLNKKKNLSEITPRQMRMLKGSIIFFVVVIIFFKTKTLLGL
jgi:hypothetical protein